jgi:uncharacterized membrane protein
MEKIKKVAWSAILVSAIGLIDSIYLTYKHYNNELVPCGVFSGCESVQESFYSMIYTIPLSIFGIIFYATMILLILLYMKKNRGDVMTTLLASAWAGFVFSIYLSYLQLFVIGAICSSCAISALTSFILFGLIAYLYNLHKKTLKSRILDKIL